MRKAILLGVMFLLAFSISSIRGNAQPSFCRNITFSGAVTDVNYTDEWVEQNFTDLTFSSINELRINSSSCWNGGSQIDRDIISSGSNWADIGFYANYTQTDSNHKYSIYYDAAGTGDPATTNIFGIENTTQINTSSYTNGYYAYVSGVSNYLDSLCLQNSTGYSLNGSASCFNFHNGAYVFSSSKWTRTESYKGNLTYVLNVNRTGYNITYRFYKDYFTMTDNLGTFGSTLNALNLNSGSGTTIASLNDSTNVIQNYTSGTINEKNMSENWTASYKNSTTYAVGLMGKLLDATLLLNRISINGGTENPMANIGSDVTATYRVVAGSVLRWQIISYDTSYSDVNTRYIIPVHNEYRVFNNPLTATEGGEQTNTPPTYNNNGTNNTNPDPLSQVLFYTNWSDETGLSGYIFSWNATGSTCSDGFANDTFTSFSGLTNWSNVTKQAPLACAGKTIDFLFYANDTSNNWNKTADMIENEQKNPTLTALYLNGSFVPNNYIINATYWSVGNTTAVVNVTDLNVSILINNTLVATGTTSAEIVGVLGAGYYNLTGYTDGNSSFSASSSTYFVNISKATPTLNLTFNTSDTVVEGAPVLVTCSDTVSLNLYNDTDSISNPTILDTSSLSGVYNFTCNTTGNANYTTATTSKTLTVTLTPPPNTTSPYPLNTSWSWCTSNSTLQIHAAVYNNGTFYTSNDSYISCSCDNTTNSCDPPVYQQNLFDVGIIIVIIIAIALIYRFRRG